jgi:hypothetical protein
VITSGLLQALQGRGIEDIVELEYTGRKIAVQDFIGAYGSGRGASLNTPGAAPRSVLFPEIRFNTNDSWPLVRGIAEARGVPILLMNRYSSGVLYVLNIPDNPGDLYELPQPLTRVIRSYLQPDFPVRLDAPARVSLFAYDNGTFVVQSFRSESVSIDASLAGTHTALVDLLSGQRVAAAPAASGASTPAASENRTTFVISIPPHSYRAFAVE